MNRTRFRNTVLGIGATAVAIAFGYFGVQYFGRNNMFTIAAAVGGAGAISYVLQKPSQPEAPTAPIKTQRRRNKS
ncbi:MULTISPECIES: hypothetical protein [Nostoc]|uniref:DUF3188 domain-containing protein n=1 Tax=Nostoc paludosum FACHB-159 TaxID=2692908 RepID=A0ABR8KQ54_9NOSO|nr:MULTISPECIES: hypothetical protein [Nostoc]MBD2683499.1 hypothetical protein [Nostoc sp. FACHB-857]MBD2739823.1 hypothetical protein [Nostoc paludosum FACHB-159]